MKRFLNRRTLGLLGLALTAQLLSACVVVPVPHARHRPVVVDVQPGYAYPDRYPQQHHHRHHHRHRDYRR